LKLSEEIETCVIELRELTFLGTFEEYVPVPNLRRKHLAWGKCVISQSFPWKDMQLRVLSLDFEVKNLKQHLRVVSL